MHSPKLPRTVAPEIGIPSSGVGSIGATAPVAQLAAHARSIGLEVGVAASQPWNVIVPGSLSVTASASGA